MSVKSKQREALERAAVIFQQTANTYPDRREKYICEAALVKNAIGEERNCERFDDWESALNAYENAVAPKWAKDWNCEDWLKFVKWLFATTWDGKPPTANENGTSS